MALSSRAHAFSVESLVGNSRKRKHEDTGNEKLREQLNDTRNLPARPKYEEDEQSGKFNLSNMFSHRGPKGLFLNYSVRRSIDQAIENISGSNDYYSESPAMTGVLVAEGANTQTSPTSLGGESEGLRVELQGTDLWKRFHEIGTEMIITKAGRRMFPAVRVKIRGLEPEKQYYIAMDIIPVDSKRYRYVYHSSQWVVAANTEQSPQTPRLYVHPDSPTSGQSWMKQVISFDRVKLTNNDMDEKGHIILQSMHKYRPRIHVIVKEADMNMPVNELLPSAGVHIVAFSETEFTTVTAYQNQQITRLKIDRNPFAKGFRDPGRNRISLERVMDSYSWRPTHCRPSLDFQALNIQKPVGYSDSLLGNSSAGTPSSLNAEVFPTCSPGLFHANSGSVAMTYRYTHRYSHSGPVCHKVVPGPHRFVLPAWARPRVSNVSPDLLVRQRLQPLVFRFPSLSSLPSLTASNGKGCIPGLQLAPTLTLAHLPMQSPGSAVSLPNHSHPGLQSWSARRPWYNLPAPSRPAAGPLKLMAQRTAAPLSQGTTLTERSFREAKDATHCL
ncbi:T-box transcription factor TBX22-like [Narcine bancroftii]|uniref:T-box transcription factor TBX22-like n=1 Tax=Narcine bancroftii TaxID=1343680 RepID=UPI0038321078